MAETVGLTKVVEVLDEAASIPAPDMFVEEFTNAMPAGGKLSPEEVEAFALLAEQSVRRGVDYATLGLGWDHPEARVAYREARHRSFTCKQSRTRQQQSKAQVLEALKAGLAGGMPGALTREFLRQIGAKADFEPTFAATLAALRAELVLPLRALNEGQESMTRTFNGAPVPAGPIADTVATLTRNVLLGTYKQWRYTNPIGKKQLEGLSEDVQAIWAESTSREGPNGLRTHEDQDSELGLFWATKIGGPSHGFDIEGQCLLPLLCNARHKVVLVSDPAWPHHPAGRAHFRLLWTATPPSRPLLWLETINSDFRASVSTRAWGPAVLTHVVEKAERMGVMLWVDAHHQPTLMTIAKGRGEVTRMQDRLVLRPSNGVLEASDYLGNKHDWPQMSEEVTPMMSRVAFIPNSIGNKHDET